MCPGEIRETRTTDITNEKQRFFLLFLPPVKLREHFLIGHCRQFYKLGRLALFFFTP